MILSFSGTCKEKQVCLYLPPVLNTTTMYLQTLAPSSLRAIERLSFFSAIQIEGIAYCKHKCKYCTNSISHSPGAKFLSCKNAS